LWCLGADFVFCKEDGRKRGFLFEFHGRDMEMENFVSWKVSSLAFLDAVAWVMEEARNEKFLRETKVMIL